MTIVSGILSGLIERDHCGECGIELPEYWGEEFYSIKCYEKESKE